MERGRRRPAGLQCHVDGALLKADSDGRARHRARSIYRKSPIGNPQTGVLLSGRSRAACKSCPLGPARTTVVVALPIGPAGLRTSHEDEQIVGLLAART